MGRLYFLYAALYAPRQPLLTGAATALKASVKHRLKSAGERLKVSLMPVGE